MINCEETQILGSLGTAGGQSDAVCCGIFCSMHEATTDTQTLTSPFLARVRAASMPSVPYMRYVIAVNIITAKGHFKPCMHAVDPRDEIVNTAGPPCT